MGDLAPGPAWANLADALTLLIGDGRIPLGVRLPSERELTAAIGLSRTTVSRAYAALRDSGYAHATQGAGTFTAVPGGRERAHDRVLAPKGVGEDWIDLNCTADSAPADVMSAYTAALSQLPAYLGGHGYFPGGLPVLQEAVAATYAMRGLPTTPDQIVVTPGSLAAASVVARALASRRTRALVESPTYPNAAEALRASGARLHEAPLDAHGWDIAGIMETVKQVKPDFVYLVPDFQNPTGAVMTADHRKRLGKHLLAHAALPIVDETNYALALDGQQMPPPFAAFHPDAITLGSMSKAFWGGLRVGWIRAPRHLVERLTRARLSLDLGVPVLEQLAATHLLRSGPAATGHLHRLRLQRDALIHAVESHLPGWRFVPPAGGMALWCELPRRGATALASMVAANNVIISPGPVFSLGGGLDKFVRLPWTRPANELQDAVERIAIAWHRIEQHGHHGHPTPTHGRFIVV